jgi:hypothetical protein
MSDWQVVEPAKDGTPGKVRHVRAYPLKPGMAKVYNDEGRNMEGQPRGGRSRRSDLDEFLEDFPTLTASAHPAR